MQPSVNTIHLLVSFIQRVHSYKYTSSLIDIILHLFTSVHQYLFLFLSFFLSFSLSLSLLYPRKFKFPPLLQWILCTVVYKSYLVCFELLFYSGRFFTQLLILMHICFAVQSGQCLRITSCSLHTFGSLAISFFLSFLLSFLTRPYTHSSIHFLHPFLPSIPFFHPGIVGIAI